MTLNKKILKFLNETEDIKDWNLSQYEDIEMLAHRIEEKGLIDFSVIMQTSGSDYWMQVEYYSEAIKKSIIWANSCYDSFESFEELAKTLADTQKAINTFENNLKNKLK